MQQKKSKQSRFSFQKAIFSSEFESGNLEKVTNPADNQYSLWIGPDHSTSYRTWFFFSVEAVKPGSTLTFTIMNMSNQVKLYKEGMLPVCRAEGCRQWGRIRLPMQQNAVVKGQEGFQVTFKHCFNQDCKYYFAFTYPWTNEQSRQLLQGLIEQNKARIFCQASPLCLSFQKRPVTILTLTKSKGGQLQFEKMITSGAQVYEFKGKIGVFISARVHPGETASSHIMNGIIKNLFTDSQLAATLLEACVFYIVPIINPDGVAEGNFRADTQGKNLNRHYTNPSQQSEPEIYGIKQFLVSMIQRKRISFCLDLHAHVNKQGSFIYGNSTSSLAGQMRVCLFPKLLAYNCQFFDYGSCNFSQKNMQSKDKGDELSKEGASRVAIFKETGMVECWTLECNYNSASVTHALGEPAHEARNSSVSNNVLLDKLEPEDKQQLRFLNIEDFEKLGLGILESIADYYQLRPMSRIFATKVKNMDSLKIHTAIGALRLMPFRFDNECRKLLDSLNNGSNIKASVQRIGAMLGLKGNKVPFQAPLTSRHIKSEHNNSEYSSKRQQSKYSTQKQASRSRHKQLSLHRINQSQSQKKQKIAGKIIKPVEKPVKVNMPPLPKPKMAGKEKLATKVIKLM